MNDASLLQHLEDIAHRLGIQLRYETLGTNGLRCEGGYCRAGGKEMILINRKDSRQRKIRILAKALGRANLEGVFVPPRVRQIIETQNV
jgi:hypothetical protein